MLKTTTPVPRATHTTVDVEIDGLDAYIENHPSMDVAESKLHPELHTISSHIDTNQPGSVLDELVSGAETTLHDHDKTLLDGGEF